MLDQDASGDDRPPFRPTTPTPTFKEMATSLQAQARHPHYRQHRCIRSCHPRGHDDGVATGSRREVKLEASVPEASREEAPSKLIKQGNEPPPTLPAATRSRPAMYAPDDWPTK